MAPIMTDQEHRARWDAESLAQAEKIKADPERLSRAKEAAKKLADEEAEDARAMRKVAGRRTQSRASGPSGSTTRIKKTPTQPNDFNVFKRI